MRPDARALGLLLGLAAGCARGTPEAHQRPPAAPLAVPMAGEPIIIDGALGERAWRAAARTGPFLDEAGHIARPQSEARWLRDRDVLYVALYAADEDLRSAAGAASPRGPGDAFELRLEVDRGPALARYALELGADGHVTERPPPTSAGAPPGAEGALRAAVLRDGTLDDPSDDDEEWVVEVALPLRALGLAGGAAGTVRARLGRCDVPKDGLRRCGAWGAAPSGAPATEARLLLESGPEAR